MTPKEEILLDQQFELSGHAFTKTHYLQKKEENLKYAFFMAYSRQSKCFAFKKSF